MVDADIQEILDLQHSNDIIQQIINGNNKMNYSAAAGGVPKWEKSE